MRKLAVFAAGFTCAVFISQYLLPVRWLPIGAAAVMLLAFLGFLLREDVRKRIFLCALGAAVGFMWTYGYDMLVFSPAESFDGAETSVTAVVSDFPQTTDYGSYFDGRLLLEDSVDIKFRGYVFSGEADGLRPGDKVTFSAEFSLADNIDGEPTSYFTSRGIALFASDVSDVKVVSSPGVSLRYLHCYVARAIKDTCDRVFPLGTSGFMRALLTGDRIVLNEDEALVNAMSRSGVTHIIAISGLHVSILAGFIMLLCGRRRIAVVIAAPVLFIFMGVSGFRPSVIRAVVMQLFLLTAPVFNRESDSLTSLSAALLMILAVNPCAAADVGLQLSFAATLGIILFSQKINVRISRLMRGNKSGKGTVRVIRFVSGSISTTLGALVLTTPLTVIYFKYISLVAPIVNLLILWAITPVFIFGVIAVAAGLIWLPAGTVVGWAAAVGVKFITFVIGIFSKPFFAAIYIDSPALIGWFAVSYIVIGLILCLTKLARAIIVPVSLSITALCAIIVLNVYLYNDISGYSLTVLDVGQGQSICISSGGYTALIDCGSSSGEDAGEIAERYIRGMGRDAVDIIVLTHFHEDHANGVTYLLSCLDVGAIIAPEPEEEDGELEDEILALASQRDVDIIYVDEDVTVSLGDTRVTLYAPLGSQSENERGIMAVITDLQFDTLITGDVDSSIERMLLRHTELPDIECLIVGHHGSKYSTSQELLDAAQPETAIISVGDNSYGHPTQETLERLEENGVEVFRTDLNGNITVNSRSFE